MVQDAHKTYFKSVDACYMLLQEQVSQTKVEILVSLSNLESQAEAEPRIEKSDGSGFSDHALKTFGKYKERSVDRLGRSKSDLPYPFLDLLHVCLN